MRSSITWDDVMRRATFFDEGRTDIDTDLSRARFTTRRAPNDEVQILADLPGHRATLDVNDNALGQIARVLGIPMPYLKTVRTRSPELVENMLRDGVENAGNRPMLFRAHNTNLAGVLSPKFARDVTNLAVVEAMRAQLRGIEHTVVDYGVSANSGRSFLKVVMNDTEEYDPSARHARDRNKAVGDTVAAGVTILNGEYGDTNFRVAPFIYRLVCTNGMTANRLLGGQVVAPHLNLTVPAVGLKIGAAIAEVMLSHEDAMAKFVATTSIVLKDVMSTLDKVAEIGGIKSDKDRSRLLHAFDKEPQPTAFNVINAVTRFARTKPEATRQNLEDLAGQLVSYTPDQWHAMAA